MFIEEYEDDKLVKAQYFRNGKHAPESFVVAGKGTATLFNPEGNFIRKVFYNDGIPIQRW